MTNDEYYLVPIMDVEVGHYLPSWGEVTAIRDTPRRRYLTVIPINGGEPITNYQDNQTRIVVRRKES